MPEDSEIIADSPLPDQMQADQDQLDLEELARLVAELLLRELAIENERTGIY